MKIICDSSPMILLVLIFLFCFGNINVYCKKVMFIDMLNGINISSFKKNIQKHSISYEICPISNNNHSPSSNPIYKQKIFLSKSPTNATVIKEKISPSLTSKTIEPALTSINVNSSVSVNVDVDNNQIIKEKILQQYIYTLSHLTNFDVNREKKIPLNISLLIKACLASHNYIKNVEIYTSQVLNKEVCSFIYENKESFDEFFNLHILKYNEYISSLSDLPIEDMIKTYITDTKLFENELHLYKKIEKKNVELKKDVLNDILFECIRLNKIIQYSLAVNRFDMFSYHVTYKIFMYFKSQAIYYDILLHNFSKIKHFYHMQNIKEEEKMKINTIVDNYLLLFKHMDDIYERIKTL